MVGNGGYFKNQNGGKWWIFWKPKWWEMVGILEIKMVANGSILKLDKIYFIFIFT